MLIYKRSAPRFHLRNMEFLRTDKFLLVAYVDIEWKNDNLKTIVVLKDRQEHPDTNALCNF
jgi:hypothetical protein